MTTKSTIRRKPTQFDVAKAAGVSQTTVSLVLNNPETNTVPEETRNKVLEAIRALGYVPNSTARTLRTSRTFTLACVIPMLTNPFYPAFVSGVQEEAERSGYEVITYNTHGSAEREAHILASVQQGRVDGLIGVFFYTRARDLKPIFENQLPVVRLEVRRRDTGDWPLDNVYVDNAMAAYTATSYLIDRAVQDTVRHEGDGNPHKAAGNRTTIAMITGPAGPRDARRNGYTQALAERMPEMQPCVVEVESFNERGGAQGIAHLLQGELPRAVFAANDLMAIGALKALRDAGLHVPEDVAVVGFDDIPAAAMVTPALTTIHQDQEGMGRRAASLLIERLSGQYTGSGRSVEMPFELVIRGSA